MTSTLTSGTTTRNRFNCSGLLSGWRPPKVYKVRHQCSAGTRYLETLTKALIFMRSATGPIVEPTHVTFARSHWAVREEHLRNHAVPTARGVFKACAQAVYAKYTCLSDFVPERPRNIICMLTGRMQLGHACRATLLLHADRLSQRIVPPHAPTPAWPSKQRPWHW